jgi:fructokinase
MNASPAPTVSTTCTFPAGTRTVPAPHIATAWQALGPSIVAVTMGDRGAFAVSGAGVVHVDARPVQVVDTLGAGDAFMTGLIDALWTLDLLGAERRRALAAIGAAALQSVLAEATLASALTVARAGADLPDRAALQRGQQRG